MSHWYWRTAHMLHSQATCIACVAGEIKGDLLLFFGGGAVRILVASHKTQRAIPPATQAKAAQAVI